jgi:PHD/YefM family antitoxin component YafN of YafNO toxin-antitoxin module
MYRIETTDPITGRPLKDLVDMPYVIENDNEDNVVIYFESEYNRDLYLQNPAQHRLEHNVKRRS